MPTPTVVIAQRDPIIERELANNLRAHFARVAVAHDAAELRAMLQHHEARLAVLDLELINIQAVQNLSALFGDLVIVCTHRTPDEQMWTAALNAGAVEFCHARDLRSILHAARLAVQPRFAAQEEEEVAA